MNRDVDIGLLDAATLVDLCDQEDGTLAVWTPVRRDSSDGPRNCMSGRLETDWSFESEFGRRRPSCCAEMGGEPQRGQPAEPRRAQGGIPLHQREITCGTALHQLHEDPECDICIPTRRFGRVVCSTTPPTTLVSLSQTRPGQPKKKACGSASTHLQGLSVLVLLVNRGKAFMA